MACNVHNYSMMRGIARFMAVSAGLLVGALVAVSLVWMVIMIVLNNPPPLGVGTKDGETTENDINMNEATTDSPAEVPPETSGTVIDVTKLPDVQQKTLNTFGFEGETITISDSQMQCAEAAVGKERLAEIIAGDAPGPIEASKLYGCKDQ